MIPTINEGQSRKLLRAKTPGTVHLSVGKDLSLIKI